MTVFPSWHNTEEHFGDMIDDFALPQKRFNITELLVIFFIYSSTGVFQLARMASHSNLQSTKSSVKPFRPKSLTLLNETGNVEIYRVSEETKKKVEEDSQRIRQQNLDHYHRSRRIIKRKEHEKLKVIIFLKRSDIFIHNY